jgi:hypothetical protein
MSDFTQVIGGRSADAFRHCTNFITIHATISAMAFAIWRAGALASVSC